MGLREQTHEGKRYVLTNRNRFEPEGDTRAKAATAVWHDRLTAEHVLSNLTGTLGACVLEDAHEGE